jgi:hypothetical protein
LRWVRRNIVACKVKIVVTVNELADVSSAVTASTQLIQRAQQADEVLPIDCVFTKSENAEHGKGPNENKISHRWRERAWAEMEVVESSKARSYAGQWLAASLG